MKLSRLIRYFLLTLPLIPCGGCATHALWTEVQLDNWNEPADDVHLRVYNGVKQKDLLVVYDEYSERYDSIHPRAYWLYRNQERLSRGLRPSFSRVDLSRRLKGVPILPAPLGTTNLPPELLYAVSTANSQTFAVFSGNHEMGSHDLPVYNDGKGEVERLALTPLSVVADVTIVGGYL